MDTSVQRVQPEPVVPGLRHAPRSPERRRRDGEKREGEPSFPLEPRPAHARPAHDEHHEPRSPNGDGLGERLDVTA